jgi:translation initiation factor IF-1
MFVMAFNKLYEITARNTLPGQTPIAMAAHVIELLPQGGRRVRLANNHELDVLGSGRRSSEVSLVGDVVTVQLASGQLHGWRLV